MANPNPPAATRAVPESPADMIDISVELYRRHSPANSIERGLVDSMVHNEWRSRGLRAVESALSKQGDSAAALRRVERMASACERSYRRALKMLIELQTGRTRALRAPQAKPSKSTSKSSGLIRTKDAAAARGQDECDKAMPLDPSFPSLRWIC